MLRVFAPTSLVFLAATWGLKGSPMSLRRTDHNFARLARLGWGLLLVVLATAMAERANATDPSKKKVTISPAQLASPDHFRCVGKNRFSGAVSVPTERNGVTTDSAYAMFFIDPVHGHATIIYGERYQQAPALFQAFIRRHECQHANGVLDEITANCRALAQMRALGLTVEQEAQLAGLHGAEGPLDARYGGSGAGFWQRTVACAGSR